MAAADSAYESAPGRCTVPLYCSRREPENASKRQPSTVQALSKHPTFLSKHPRNHVQKPGFYCPSFAREWPFYNIKFRNSDLTHAWERATHPACDVKSRILPRERFDAFLRRPVTPRSTPSHFLQCSSLSSPQQWTPSPGIACGHGVESSCSCCAAASCLVDLIFPQAESAWGIIQVDEAWPRPQTCTSSYVRICVARLP